MKPLTYLLGRTPARYQNYCPIYKLPSLTDDGNQCPHCQAYRWPGERGAGESWPCCQNSKIDQVPPDSPLPQNIDELTDPEEQRLERAVLPLNKLLYEVEQMYDANGMPVQDEQGRPVCQRTPRSKSFMALVMSYNNIMSFTSEGVGRKDHEHSGWSTFRMQGGFYHYLGNLLPDPGHRQKFAQMYTMQASQDETNVRQQQAPQLDQGIIRMIQTVMHQVNPYAQGFKNCAKRLQESSNPDLRMHILQADPHKANRSTHNKPTSDEVAQVLLNVSAEGAGPIDRDIIVETKEGGLQRVPYWHVAYMPLRYPILFPFGEAGWHRSIPLRGHNILPNDHLLADRNRNKRQGTLQHHNLRAPIDEAINADAAADESAPRGRGGSRRVTARNMYCY